MKYILPFLLLLGVSSVTAQSNYKEMMNDPSVNFYDVVEAAENYFKTHDTGKGSGYKGYQRWKAENEGKYYPSGDRSNVDPYLVTKAYQKFLKSNSQQKSSFNNGWRDLGPYDANNITDHYAPGIGRVETFYVDPSNPNRIYLGSRSGGFWYTNDEGATWTNSTDFMFATGVNTLTASPTNSDSVVINLRNPLQGASHGLYRSTDGGATFTITAFNPTNLGWGGLGTNDDVYKIAYHPLVADLIFIGTDQGLFRSDDNLQTWTQHINGGDITDIQFHPIDPNIIYLYDNDGGASNPDAILRSTDMGLTFTNSATIVGNSNSRGHMDVSADCPDCLFFGSSNGFWKSTDQGQNFTFMFNPPQSCAGIAVSEVDTSHILYGYVDLEMSADGGTSFTQRTWWANGNPDTTYVHADLRIAENVNGVFYVGTDGYLCKSLDNGLSWTRLNDGTGIKEFYRAGLSQCNWQVAVAGSQDNGSSVLLENGWAEWNGGDGMEGICQPLNDTWMLGSWQYGTRFRSKDKAQTWHGTGTPQSGYWIAPLMLDPNQQMRVYHCVDTLFKSEAFGTGWEFVSAPGIGDIKHAAIAENNSDIMVVARNSSILKSIDGGVTWTSIASGLPGHSVSDIAFAPLNDNVIVVIYERYQNDGQKVYISFNGGSNWTNITGALGDMPIRSVAIDHTDAQNIYLGAEMGVYTKPMYSGTWVLYNQNLPNVAVRELEIQYGTNILRAITWGRGMWEYTLVGRNDHPNIWTTTITDPPTDVLPNEVDPQYVTCVMSDDVGITSAYVKWSAGSPTFDSTIVMSNTVDSTWVSDFPIPGQPEGSDVYFKVFAVGASGDTTETYKFHFDTKPNCVSNGNMSWQTAVTLVDFEDINNSTGKLQPYTDYRESDSTCVFLDSTYSLTLNLNTDGNYTCHGMVWIDWNDDADYDDPGEEYSLGSAQNTPDGPTTLSPIAITVPSNSVLGHITMRVSARYGSPATSCETNYDGEVEDYLLVVKPACTNSVSAITETVCNSYTAPSGTNYAASGTYTDIIPNATGCDSIITINLTVNIDQASTINESVCDSFVLNGQTYTASGNYTQTLTAVNGCDSVITLNLAVNDNNINVTMNSNVLTSDATGVSYQWVNCLDDFSEITGETGQSFTATQNGVYAVVVYNGMCTDTSACYTIANIGIEEALDASLVNVYPNPSDDLFNIEVGGGISEFEIEVVDVLGKLITRQQVNGNNYQLKLDEAPAVYFLTVRTQSGQATLKLVKE